MLSIIVPTRNERENIQPLAERVDAALSGIDYELVFVDDSTDDTPRQIAFVRDIFPRIRHLHRKDGNGLSGAVLDGFRIAKGNYMIVMDADLQHPPELLPRIYEELLNGADIVIPSRYTKGGNDGGFSPVRRFVSWAARTTGKALVPFLRGLTDVTGGYFGFHHSVIEYARIEPRGWKILIDVLAKGTYCNVKEIPYQFAERNAGKSKLSSGVSLDYLAQVFTLAYGPESLRFIKFCAVGVSGVLINLAAFWAINRIANDGIFASVLSSILAMVSNFYLNNRFTWTSTNRKGPLSVLLRLLSYFSVSIMGITTTTAIYGICSDFIPSLLAQFVGIAATATWTFFAHDNLTWRNKQAKERKAANTPIN